MSVLLPFVNKEVGVLLLCVFPPLPHDWNFSCHQVNWFIVLEKTLSFSSGFFNFAIIYLELQPQCSNMQLNTFLVGGVANLNVW